MASDRDDRLNNTGGKMLFQAEEHRRLNTTRSRIARSHIELTLGSEPQNQ